MGRLDVEGVWIEKDGDGDLWIDHFGFTNPSRVINAIAEVCGLTVTIGDQPPVYDAQFDALTKRVEWLEQGLDNVEGRVNDLEAGSVSDEEQADAETTIAEVVYESVETTLRRFGIDPDRTPVRMGRGAL